MEPTLREELHNFPMGPKVGAWLGVNQEKMTNFDDRIRVADYVGERVQNSQNFNCRQN